VWQIASWIQKVFLMKLFLNHSTPVALAVLCLLFVSGCMSTTATNFSERGSPATEAEVVTHFSGNFVRVGQGGAFYAADGTFQSVGPAGEQISIGTWSPGKALCVNTTYYGIQNGQTASRGPEKDCYFIWINGDGTAMADPMGIGPNLDLARPERGFPIQARFNALRRNLGV
jgi:predicted outer membrane repeat protein